MNTRGSARFLQIFLLLACWSLNQACDLATLPLSYAWFSQPVSFSSNTIKYLSPTYSMEDVYSYRLDWSCDHPKTSGANPNWKDTYCAPLSSAIPNSINKLVSGLEMDEAQPDLIISVELKEIQGGWNYWGGSRDFVRLVFDLKIIRWGTVIAEHRYLRQFQKFQHFLQKGRGASDSVFVKHVGLVAKDIHQIVFDPKREMLPRTERDTPWATSQFS